MSHSLTSCDKEASQRIKYLNVNATHRPLDARPPAVIVARVRRRRADIKCHHICGKRYWLIFTNSCSAKPAADTVSPRFLQGRVLRIPICPDRPHFVYFELPSAIRSDHGVVSRDDARLPDILTRKPLSKSNPRVPQGGNTRTLTRARAP